MKQIFTLLFILSFSIELFSLPVSMIPSVASMSQQTDLTALSVVSERENFKVRIYPNPATDFIRVEWEADQDIELYVELFDLVGRRISQRKSEESINRIHIDMKSFQRSAYLLKVFTVDGKYSRTFRVVKN